MCRNILELRGLDPPATDDEIEAAARQYVRKISGIRQPSEAVLDAGYEEAVAEIARVSADLLRALPPRRQPPKVEPPLRRPEVRSRLGLPPRS
ncbi:MAG: DUF2277 domain-containing protein [Actinobacteria bacterium]|nr:DUF2277 domain-containing protein [Actinomycetota bacterium]